MKNKTWLKIGAAAVLATIAISCDSLQGNQSHHATSLFAYLYSGKLGHVDQPGIPELSLPLRVGVAFVPANRPRSRGNYDNPEGPLAEEQKASLLKTVSAQFKDLPFVSSIQIIPSAYLVPEGGFANLDQIKTMYDVDVIALVAYDQAQFTDEGLLSLSYWTVVGAYVVRGEKNETRIMMDAAVYDVASRKLLFRAPGFGTIKRSATWINLNEQLRHDSERGFQQATTNLTANLKVALKDFQDQVKAAPAEYHIIKKPGYTGAAAAGGMEVALLGGLGLCRLCLGRRQTT